MERGEGVAPTPPKGNSGALVFKLPPQRTVAAILAGRPVELVAEQSILVQGSHALRRGSSCTVARDRGPHRRRRRGALADRSDELAGFGDRPSAVPPGNSEQAGALSGGRCVRDDHCAMTRCSSFTALTYRVGGLPAVQDFGMFGSPSVPRELRFGGIAIIAREGENAPWLCLIGEGWL